MPNITILPQGLEDEADDAPKKFRNIDTEPFEFWWGGKPFGGIFPERTRSWQEEDLIRDAKGQVVERKMVTKYEFLKYIEPNEMVIMPKYLVNYAAMHLARKIFKRKVFAGKSEAERSVGILKFINVDEEIKLMKQIVADNFGEVPQQLPQQPSQIPTTPSVPPPAPPQVPTIPPEIKTEENKKPEEVSYKCEICGQVAKNKVGLLAHKRFKHKT